MMKKRARPAVSPPLDRRTATGRVIRGSRRGHELGFPTANLEVESGQLPPSGIYAMWVRLEGEPDWRPAAASVGYNPTFPQRDRRMEVHILDYAGGELYGQLLEVVPLAYLRSEERYDTSEALIRQMQRDCAQARSLLRRASPPPAAEAPESAGSAPPGSTGPRPC